jgi:hypothetical protein
MSSITESQYEQCLNLLVSAISNKEGFPFNDIQSSEYKVFRTFIQKELADKRIIKHTEFKFTGSGLAELLTQKLDKLNLKVVDEIDDKEWECSVRVMGQAVYFIVHNEENQPYGVIFTWSLNPITFTSVVKKI